MPAGKQDQDVDAMLARLLEGKRPEKVIGSGGLLENLTNRLVERALEGERSQHVGYEMHDCPGREVGDPRGRLTPVRRTSDHHT